jgi:predicted nucleotidyltransferase component of viral defense system
MLHRNRDDFVRTLNQVAMQTGFLLPLVEKDYYLTVVLSRLHELSPDLIFKGGTCLNKIYYSYYRLSEDLDFTMHLPSDAATRAMRRKCIGPVKERIEAYAARFDMRVDDTDEAGRNESKQYVYHFLYKSAVLPVESKIKVEIGLRFNPVCAPERKRIQHGFLHPFTGQPLFGTQEVLCLALKEIVAEKLRAATTRQTIAPRDFYDIDYIIRNGFEVTEPEVLTLFRRKLEEDNADTDLARYSVNLGRRADEIRDMKRRIKEELYEVLTPGERSRFDLDAALGRINVAFAVLRNHMVFDEGGAW